MSQKYIDVRYPIDNCIHLQKTVYSDYYNVGLVFIFLFIMFFFEHNLFIMLDAWSLVILILLQWENIIIKWDIITGYFKVRIREIKCLRNLFPSFFS